MFALFLLFVYYIIRLSEIMKKILITILAIIFIFMQKTGGITIQYKNQKKQIQYDNYGYIIIPKIDLNKKFEESSNVDKGIIIINPSKYPNVDKSLLILAGHSGTGKYAYFNYLYKLNISDKIVIKYMGCNYYYEIIDIYYQKKTGKLKVYKKKNQNTLILITCTNNNKKTQTVYVSILYKTDICNNS